MREHSFKGLPDRFRYPCGSCGTSEIDENVRPHSSREPASAPSVQSCLTLRSARLTHRPHALLPLHCHRVPCIGRQAPHGPAPGVGRGAQCGAPFGTLSTGHGSGAPVLLTALLLTAPRPCTCFFARATGSPSLMFIFATPANIAAWKAAPWRHSPAPWPLSR